MYHLIQQEGSLLKWLMGKQFIVRGVVQQYLYTCRAISIPLISYILTLGGCDIILGVQWLRTLAPILWNFPRLQMESTVWGKSRKLQDMSPPVISLVEGENFGEVYRQNKRGLFIQLIDFKNKFQFSINRNFCGPNIIWPSWPLSWSVYQIWTYRSPLKNPFKKEFLPSNGLNMKKGSFKILNMM